MSVKYSWSRQNGAAVPPVRFMSIEPAADYYKGMPLKLKEKGIVEPTDGDPEYICMAQYDPDAEIQPLEIPVQEVFPDVVYDRMNDDGTIEEVRFGSKGGGGDLLETVETEVPLEITWDGDLTGKEVVDQIGSQLVKVSNAVLSYEQIVGSTVIFYDGITDQTLVLTSDNVTDMSVVGIPANMIVAIEGETTVGLVCCVQSDFSQDGLTLTAGVWCLYYGAGEGYWVKSLTCPNATTTTTKTQLKPSLLPYNEIIEKVLEAIPTAEGVSF